MIDRAVLLVVCLISSASVATAQQSGDAPDQVLPGPPGSGPAPEPAAGALAEPGHDAMEAEPDVMEPQPVSPEPGIDAMEPEPIAPELDEPEVSGDRESYWGAMLAAYLLAPLAAGLVGGLTESAGGLIFFAAPPLVHVGYGNYSNALLTTLMMPGVTFLGAFLGFMLDRPNCSGEFLCGLAGAAVGTIAGYTLWASIDIAVFSHREVPRGRGRSFGAVVITPIHGGAQAAVVGRF